MKCIVCELQINPEELAELAHEFEPYPVHRECFDEFENADEFLAYVKSVSKIKPEDSPAEKPAEI